MHHIRSVGGEGASDYVTGVLGEVHLHTCTYIALYGGCSCTESAVAT